MNRKYIILVPFILISGFIISYEEMPEKIELSNSKKIKFIKNIEYPYSYNADTFYLLGNEYISISLKEQKATLFLRNDSNITFNISSGNANIPKGLSTPTGLFTVQSKNPKAVSKQFNNAELFSWIGFNGNIGFHGLSGSGYYNHLGVRPSSHGCIRISRHDGEILYKKVRIGTPVLVYDKQSAIALQFSDTNIQVNNKDFIFKQKDKPTNLYFRNRMKHLYSGNLFKYGFRKVYFDGKSVIRNRGLQIGNLDSVPFYQKPSYDAFMIKNSK